MIEDTAFHPDGVAPSKRMSYAVGADGIHRGS